MAISNPFPFSLLATIFILFILGIILSGRECIAQTGKRIGLLIIFMRLLALLTVFAIFVNPYYEEILPDRNTYVITVLADVSGSMQTIDGDQELRRIDILSKLLDASTPGSMISRLREKHAVVLKVFDEEVSTFTAGSAQRPLQNRATALGDALMSSINSSSGDRSLGGIVLLSDGHNNHGSNIQTAAATLRAANIPVTAIGIGDALSREGLSIRFAEKKIVTQIGANTRLLTTATNNGSSPVTARLDLWHGNERIDSKTLDLPPQEDISITFSVQTDYAGIDTYRIVIGNSDDTVAPPEKVDEANRKDSLLLYSERPDTRRVLYISHQLTPEYRFIKQSLLLEENINFNSLILLGDQRFYRDGDDLPDSYPEQENFWNSYDVVLINTETLESLSENVVTGLKRFVNRRGGGLLFYGVTDKDTRLKNLLPGDTTGEVNLQYPARVYIEWSALEAPDIDFTPELRPTSRIFPLSASKLSARTPVQLQLPGSDKNLALLQVQNYGAGKTAHWALPDAWRWSLADANSRAAYMKYWLYLVTWLGSGTMERIQFPREEYFHSIEEAVPLEVDITLPDYTPSTNAVAEVLITPPDTRAEAQKVSLFPDPATPGRYKGIYKASMPGTHEISYQAILEDGEVLQRKSLMAFNYHRLENTDASFQPETLKELAYVTQGAYYHYSTVLDKGNDLAIPTHDRIPEIRVKRYPARDSLVFVLAILLLGGEWLIRRKWGLR